MRSRPKRSWISPSGSFTGAVADKAGLVELADGGILFLDEVHRLGPEGQEQLFCLIDKGQFRRLGETSSKRSARVLIIAATTESLESALLPTFRRRIPMTIELPTLAQRPPKERSELIYHLFQIIGPPPERCILAIIFTGYMLYLTLKNNIQNILVWEK